MHKGTTSPTTTHPATHTHILKRDAIYCVLWIEFCGKGKSKSRSGFAVAMFKATYSSQLLVVLQRELYRPSLWPLEKHKRFRNKMLRVSPTHYKNPSVNFYLEKPSQREIIDKVLYKSHSIQWINSTWNATNIWDIFWFSWEFFAIGFPMH